MYLLAIVVLYIAVREFYNKIMKINKSEFL